MRIERTGGTARAEGALGAYARAPAREAAPPPAAVAATASVLGIPEEEFTPRVRAAIVTLMHEVERLQRENEVTRARLEDIARSADQDTLLPVLNRRAFVREVGRFIAFAERYGTPSSLIYFDLNEFKLVNDAHGHAGGDAVLAHFADVILGQIRDTDVLARIGGDEFGVILAHITRDQAARKAASLTRALQGRPAIWKGRTVPVGFSYGVCELRAGENAGAVMAQADQAMYRQKRAGK